MSLLLRRPTLETTQGNRALLDVLTDLYNVAVASQRAAAETTFASFRFTGLTGVGFVQLPAKIGADGKVLQQASVGSRVIAIVEQSGFFDNAVFFEPVISTPNQLLQTSPVNLSALTMFVVLVN